MRKKPKEVLTEVPDAAPKRKKHGYCFVPLQWVGKKRYTPHHFNAPDDASAYSIIVQKLRGVIHILRKGRLWSFCEKGVEPLMYWQYPKGWFFGDERDNIVSEKYNDVAEDAKWRLTGQ